jgi:endonuclease G
MPKELFLLVPPVCNWHNTPILAVPGKLAYSFSATGPVNDLIYRNAYVTSYNRRDRNPNWVAEHMTAESLQRGKDVDRSKSTFKEDESIPAQFRARLTDYYKSNFDRGHMVAAADVKNSQLSMNETFYLTNIAPQVGEGFNRDCMYLII